MTFRALLGTLLLSLLPMIAMGEDSSPVDQSATAPSHKTHIYKQSIAFFEAQGPWKSGRDAAFAKWKSLKSQTIDYKIAPGRTRGFFNHDPRQTITLFAADRFLIKRGLRQGAPTLRMPTASEKLIPAPEK